jgi:hypothetical protein
MIAITEGVLVLAVTDGLYGVEKNFLTVNLRRRVFLLLPSKVEQDQRTSGNI